MKVAHVINSLGRGGAEKLLSQLLPILNQSVDITLIVLTSEDNVYGNLLSRKGVKVIFLSEEYNVKNPMVFKKLKVYFSNHNFDLVHVHLFPSQYYVPFSTNSKLIFTEHSTTSKRRKKIFMPLERFIHKKYSNYIFVSNEAKYSFEKFLRDKDNAKNLVIYNGINNNVKVKIKDNLRETLHITGHQKFITMISSFKPEKDHKTLIDAVGQIPNVHLLLLGEGPMKNEILAYVKYLNLQNKIHFLGFKSNIEEYIIQSHIIVQSSHNEGFGLSVLEAMSLGKPVLVSDIDGLKEVVNNPFYRFKAGSSEELRHKIERILSESTLYSDAVNYSLKTSRKFSIDNTAKQYLELYEVLK